MRYRLLNLLPVLFVSGLIYSCSGSGEKIAPEYRDIDYDIYFGDRKEGFQASRQEEDGTFVYVYEFNDRGRGPHYDEKIRLNDQGVIEYQEVIGHNYLKDTVAEVFEVANEMAIWKSSSEEGSFISDGSAFYVSNDGSMGGFEHLVRKMLSDNLEELSLLPGGKIRLTNTWNYPVGDSLELRLIQMSGVAFTPFYVWMDSTDRVFASVSSWSATIQSGYAELTSELLEFQKGKDLEYLNTMAEELTERPSGRVVIRNASLFDSRTGNVIDGMNLIIESGTIKEVTGNEVEANDGDREIDGSGKMVLPGLFDNHVHIGRSDGVLHLAAGVTSVRDMANALDLPGVVEEFESDKVLGPRVNIMSGFIDQKGPYAGPTGKIVGSLEEGLEAVDFYADRGYDQIKLYSSIDPSWVKPLAERTHERGMRLSGHIPAHMLAKDAVKDGYDEIQHVNMVALNFLSDTIDTRTPLRFSMIAEHTHNLQVESPEFQDFLALLKERNTVVDPTVSIFEGMLTTSAGEPDPSFAAILDRLPIQVRRGFMSGGLPIPDGKHDQYKESYQRLLDIVYALHNAGIPIVPGTDALPGFGLHRELENYVRAGIPASEVLQLATIVSAELAGVDNELGVIEEGYEADLILVDGNPVESINDIRKVVLTMKKGMIYDPARLYPAIGVEPYN